jgi:hypothetical protein
LWSLGGIFPFWYIVQWKIWQPWGTRLMIFEWLKKSQGRETYSPRLCTAERHLTCSLICDLFCVTFIVLDSSRWVERKIVVYPGTYVHRVSTDWSRLPYICTQHHKGEQYIHLLHLNT